MQYQLIILMTMGNDRLDPVPAQEI